MKAILERLYNGIIKENPVLVLMLGMCPTLAVTTSAKNGLGMGLATMAVLIMSNLLISLLRKVIPNGVRVPVYIIIIASFVTKSFSACTFVRAVPRTAQFVVIKGRYTPRLL